MFSSLLEEIVELGGVYRKGRGDLSNIERKWDDDWDDKWDEGMEGRVTFSPLRDGFSIQQSIYTQLRKAKKAMEIEKNEELYSNNHMHTSEERWE